MANEATKRNETSMPHPTLQVTQELRTQESQRLFNRTLRTTDSALLWLDAVIDKISQETLDLGGEEDMRFHQVLDMIEKRLDECGQELDAELERLLSLRESHGVDLQIDHNNAISEQVKVSSPLTMKYLALFTKMDDVLEEVFVLNFGGVLGRNQRKEAANKMRKEINKIARVIIDSNSRAQELNRKNKASASKDQDETTDDSANDVTAVGSEEAATVEPSAGQAAA